MNEYKKYTITTTTELEDLVISDLSDMGIDCVEIENSLPVDDVIQGANYEELQPDITVPEGVSRVIFYTEIDADVSQVVAYFADQITEEIIREDDYANKWKEFFSAFSIGDIYIRPTWEESEAPADSRITINIDPGMSFGTGKHETTYLCIEELSNSITEDKAKDGIKVLDIGCGSGILSIAASKLGAGEVLGVDIDPDCIVSTKENYEINDLKFNASDFVTGNLIEDEKLVEVFAKKGPYNIIVANLLADIIIPMLPAIARLMDDNTYLITSGIIDFKEDAVIEAMKNAGITAVKQKAMGEWRMVAGRKN